MRPIDVYEKLIDQAKMRKDMIGCPDPDRLRRHLNDGTPIPADLLPGALVTNLTDEERECLCKLTSDEVLNRRRD